MGIWSGIKHALNSTLGTSEFKSLDKMIMGSKGLKASENFYHRVQSTTVTGEYNKAKTKNDFMIMNWSGSLKLKFSARTYNSGGFFRVLINGVSQGDIVLSNTSYAVSSTGAISFNKGDKIGITLGAYNSNGAIEVSYIDVYADVVDMSAFTSSPIA